MTITESNFSSPKSVQDDAHVATATPEEALKFSAQLRLSPTLTDTARLERVEHLVKLLHLETCRKTVLGSDLIKGVSGGERDVP